MSITCTRSHTISCGHRVHGHESKCANFHGHNYTVLITCRPAAVPQPGGWPDERHLDTVGRVIDFSEIKSICCEWLENNWDHKFLLWEEDPWFTQPVDTTNGGIALSDWLPGVVGVPFNPTAENMAAFLVTHFTALFKAAGKPIECCRIRVEETPKCWADAELPAPAWDKNEVVVRDSFGIR